MTHRRCQINAVRLGGLLCAAVNGLYALFILVHHADDPAVRPPCSRTWNFTLEGSESSSDGTHVRFVSDYASFFCLLGANALGILCGVGYYLFAKDGWSQQSIDRTWSSWNSINAKAVEVDYPIVKSRLEALPRLVKQAAKEIDKKVNHTFTLSRQYCCVTKIEDVKVSELASVEVEDIHIDDWERLNMYVRSVERKLATSAEDNSEQNFTFDLNLHEKSSGQQLESATLAAVFDNRLLSYPLGVNLHSMDLTQASGIMVCKLLSKIGARHKHAGFGSMYCNTRCPFLHFGKSKPAARIAKVKFDLQGLQQSTLDVVTSLLDADFAHALSVHVMGPCELYLPDATPQEIIDHLKGFDGLTLRSYPTRNHARHHNVLV